MLLATQKFCVKVNRPTYRRKYLFFLIGAILLWMILLVVHLVPGCFKRIAYIMDFSTSDIDQDKLIDLRGFKYVLKNDEICSNFSKKKKNLLIVISTTLDNVESRNIIRQTWANSLALKSIHPNWNIEHVFLLGISAKSSWAYLDERIKQESEKNKDMIMGNFIDSYTNLTYKQIMGFMWTLRFCSSADFILKTDDDVFVDMSQVPFFLNNLITPPINRYLMIGGILNGIEPIRTPGEKWFVSEKEFAGEYFPNYCRGMGYIISFELIEKLVIASQTLNFMSVEDICITGIFREYIEHRFNLQVKMIDIMEKFMEYDYLAEEKFELNDYSRKFKWYFVEWERSNMSQFYDLWNRVNINDIVLNQL